MSSANLFHEQTARQRIAALVDANSFLELLPPPDRVMSPYLAQLDIPVSFDDGLVIGRAQIGGKPIYLAAQVGQFVGGSVGEVHSAKLVGLFKAAARDGIPCVLLIESGGVRLHEGSSGEIGIAEAIRAIFDCRAKGVPTIAVIGTDIGSYGGMGILSTCCDFRVMTEHGRLGISGPIVIEKWMGKEAYDSSDRALVWKTSGGKTKYLLNDADALTHDDAASIGSAIKELLSKPNSLTLENIKRRQQELTERLATFGKTNAPEEIWKHHGLADIAKASLASGPEFVAMVRAGRKGL
ncbi:biotin-independent malonate decarboxylase subunit beta [soil metagenome]